MIQITLITILIIFYANCEIFIDYGVGGQGRELFKYFYDVNDNFYVDIGAYDPIFASNTLNLYTQGWGGINVDANPQRLSRFFLERPDQINLNFAVGEENTMLTLYQLAEDSSSTVSAKVKDYASAFKPLVKQIKVPSISMKQICDRYYHRKPIFLNLDIEGYGSKALQTNDWNNPKCVPQVIFSQINQQTRRSGLDLPETILKKHGYRKLPISVGLNQIYILQSVYEKYANKTRAAQAQLVRKKIMNINTMAYSLASFLKARTILVPHYQPQKDGIYYKFSKYDQNLYLDQLNRQSNLISSIKNRPIVIFHHNPEYSAIFVQNSSFTSNVVKVTQYNFTQIKVTKSDNTSYSVYVFDHQFFPKKQVKIIVMSTSHKVVENKTMPVEAKKQQNNSLLSNTTNLIIKTFNQNVQAQKQQLSILNDKFIQQMQSVNANFDVTSKRQIANLQQANKRLAIIEAKLNLLVPSEMPQGQKGPSNLPEHKYNQISPAAINNFASQLSGVTTLQSITLGTILVMSVLLCGTVWVTRKNARIKKYYKPPVQSQLSMNSQA